MDSLNSLTGMVRRCVDDYGMIAPGDRIAMGVSGGKDSLVLLCALAHLRRYYPVPFQLEAITVDMGFPDMDFGPVEELCRSLEVPYTLVPTDIREIVFDVRQEENPCSLCAKMRRGALNTTLKARGCGKLALGHHFDDAVVTFAMSLLFEGRLNCFSPVTYMDRMDVTMIRPMLYIGELRQPGPESFPAGGAQHLPHGPDLQAAGGGGGAGRPEPGLPGSAQPHFRGHAASAAPRLGAPAP